MLIKPSSEYAKVIKANRHDQLTQSVITKFNEALSQHEASPISMKVLAKGFYTRIVEDALNETFNPHGYFINYIKINDTTSNIYNDYPENDTISIKIHFTYTEN